MVKRSTASCILFLLLTLAQSGPASARQENQAPETYGRVVIGRLSPQAGMPKVVFDHWLHRAKFTCRVCHVDIGFLMEAEQTGIKAADNMKGYYCGACHNGKKQIDGQAVFMACLTSPKPADRSNCDKCHSFGKNVLKKYDFYKFTAKFPRAPLGNGVDWQMAEEQGLIILTDYVQGVSVRKQAMPIQKDFSLETKGSWMGDILFSHKKHAKWNGCELCHPDIFIGVSKGATKYDMLQIYGGEYCGACHRTVAFPVQDCQRCHVKPVS